MDSNILFVFTYLSKYQIKQGAYSYNAPCLHIYLSLIQRIGRA